MKLQERLVIVLVTFVKKRIDCKYDFLKVVLSIISSSPLLLQKYNYIKYTDIHNIKLYSVHVLHNYILH